jgi:hypothetical protein
VDAAALSIGLTSQAANHLLTCAALLMMDKINPPGRTRGSFISRAMNATAVHWCGLTQHCVYSAHIAFQTSFKFRSSRKCKVIKILKITDITFWTLIKKLIY